MSNARFHLSSGGKVYGPYDTETLARFVAEKRLAHHSLVAPEGTQDFRPALQFPELRALFRPGSGEEHRAAPSPSSEGPSAAFLVAFGRASSEASKAADILRRLPSCHEITETVFLVRAAGSADELRERIAGALPSTERAFVMEASGAAIASHGIALAEHEDIRTMIKGG
ncbi:DUF4339 domain-containing protein [Parvularcula maris]|uniref:DUF4339 domain-containing protein n=1 Tax=Parvularcula maris TaxID=2965077 RepID=A0A9X2LCS0_9PROT|nr:DUF4339 domain-containing protein [Parvularcula maris]MCQ8186127.1 DUF4339 domain-containing protein [Parvularcula maris]